MVNLAAQHLGLMQGKPQFDLAHQLPAQHPQRGALQVGQNTRFGVQHAQCANRQPAVRQKRHARIKPDVFIAHDQRIVRCAHVARGVGNLDQIMLQDHMAANRPIQIGFGRIQPHARLEPLAGFIHQRNQGNRNLTNFRSQINDFIKLAFRLGVQNPKLAQMCQPFALFGVKLCAHSWPSKCYKSRFLYVCPPHSRV